jgi:hypothetical protein
MGIEYNKRAVGSQGGLALPVNAITLSSAVQTLAVGGLNAVTYDSSGNASDVLIPAPDRAGQVIRVVLNNATTSLEANFNTFSTATGKEFFGSTNNTITIASTAVVAPSFELVSVSTSRWAVTAISSTVDWTFSATTGSTGQ